MSSKVDIWMPLYVADYLSATSRLTTEQHGAYLLLLMDYWKNGPPPDNDGVLAQITRLSPSAWSNARTMLEAFFEVKSGQWSHHRVDEELAKANHNKDVNRRRGLAGAAVKYGKKDAPTMLQASLGDSTSPSPSPSPLSSSSIEEGKPSLSTAKLMACPQEEILKLWAKHLPHLAQPRSWEGSRRANTKQRWNQASKPSAYSPNGYKTQADGIRWWDSFFGYIAKDTSLSNGFETAGRTWRPDLEWVMNATNFQKIIDGKYTK
jgi:uncharacterized protein YdaU (DUF1376 family)